MSHLHGNYEQYLERGRSKFRETVHLKKKLTGGNLHTSERNSTKYEFARYNVIDKATSIMSKKY